MAFQTERELNIAQAMAGEIGAKAKGKHEFSVEKPDVFRSCRITLISGMMHPMIESFMSLIADIGNVLFHEYMIYVLLAMGVGFTLFSGFSQYFALTHGVNVVRGKYDTEGGEGAISHFQALSAALSATVGLGNIGGVAMAIYTGGPGAVLWMWVIGIVGMAIKHVEVTQSLLFRDVSDPDNPAGGPMFVAKKGLRNMGFGTIGMALGGIFVVTLLISATTGGNMFQAWNVAESTYDAFKIPRPVSGIVLALLAAFVLVGGIKRIGSVAGKLVPFMCGIYLLAGLSVVVMYLGDIPAMFALIWKHGAPQFLGGEPAAATGAFIGGSLGYAMQRGIERALFSSEAGQGSAPIAHSAVQTKEPVREGVVAGLEPFIDTLVVCTITALVILSTGAWNRDAEATVPTDAITFAAAPTEEDAWVATLDTLPERTEAAREILNLEDGQHWRDGDEIFFLVRTKASENTGTDLARVYGEVEVLENGPSVSFDPITSTAKPTLAEEVEVGLHGKYEGAALTAHAFDRAFAGVGIGGLGVGQLLVTFSAWLFALSTIISWCYYGESGIVWLGGRKLVPLYRFFYSGLVLLATMPFIGVSEIDTLSVFGNGMMIWGNIPIMLIFAPYALRAFADYKRRLRAGEFDSN